MDTLDITQFDQVITVNNRLAQAIHRRFDQSQAARGEQVWPTPNITPWHAWLRHGYEQLIDTGFTTEVLLNPHQERLLWERVVRNSPEGQQLLRPAAAARTAQQAWQLAHDWQLSEQQLAEQGSDETRAYLGWQQHFRDLCSRQQWVSSAQLSGLLLRAVNAGQLKTGKQLQLAGFDAVSPAQQALLDALEDQGCTLTIRQADQCSSDKSRVQLASAEEEMRAAATWAKNLIAQQPNAQIAIISPRLQDQRESLERICHSVISPHNLLPNHTHRQTFNISLGRPLGSYPLVAHLLLALKLAKCKRMAANEISTLLRSPFIGDHGKEWDQRAQLDFELRNDGLPQIDLFRLQQRAQSFQTTHPAHAPLLIARLQQFDALISKLPESASPNHWAGYLLQLIETLGWPGDTPPDSDEYQQAGKLREVISTLSTLTLVHQRMPLAAVLRQLEQLCEETVFQPQGSPAAIQVLGALEAAGMTFDGLWILGLDDAHWPPSPAPNPLLPTRLQQSLNMPHASAERELQFARHLTEQLFNSAPLVIVSHAETDGDRAQRPSPLIQSLPLRELAELAIEADDSLYAAASANPACEPLPAPSSVPPEQSPPGGSWLLSAQAACPFSAVGRYRLKASPLPETSAAPSAMLLGQMVHDALKRIWDQLQNAEQLRALDDESLLTLIEPQVRGTLAELGRQRPDVFTDTFIELEVQRLKTLVLDWLHLEQQRSLPFQVQQLEEKQTIELHGLSLRLQADRVDQLSDGRLVIIDYKTGEYADAKSWQDPRPNDLQIPLYCSQAQQSPAAALIGRVNSRSICFRGVANDERIVPGISAFEGDEDIPDWPALLDHWRHALQQLAEEIQQGRSDVAPQDEKTCQFCELGPLCRISSLRDMEVIDD